jgi:hypothetical protein
LTDYQILMTRMINNMYTVINSLTAVLFHNLSALEILPPINFNNIVYFINHIELKDEKISLLTPELIKTINIS